MTADSKEAHVCNILARQAGIGADAPSTTHRMETNMNTTLVRRMARPTVLLFLTANLAACATPQPPGPMVPVFAGDGKTPAEFQRDDAACRQYASTNAGDPNQAEQAQQKSAVVGTLLGAALGAAIGGAFAGGSGAGMGAAAGGGAGLATGLGSGTTQARMDRATIQQKWDVQYQMCMYNYGHKVPGFATMQQQPLVSAPPPPNPAASGTVTPTGPATSSGGCEWTGKYVKTESGYVKECL